MSGPMHIDDDGRLLWEVRRAPGPVLATAVHAGHEMRAPLKDYLHIGEDGLLRDEDPMTDLFARCAENCVRVNRSRFEFDCNRAPEEAIYRTPEDSWGIRIWKETPPEEMLAPLRAAHDRFYATMHALVREMIAEYGTILILDIHSYNHRRDGADAPPADPEKNPDIDIGATTVNKARFAPLLDRFMADLRKTPLAGRAPDVRENIRYADGGNFPESFFADYGDDACIITLEYKKVFMDEWTGQADIAALDDLRHGLWNALPGAREELAKC